MTSPSPVLLWSAVPTPLTPDLRVDEPSVARLVASAIGDGLHGLFLAGTCGEGPWLPEREKERLVRQAVQSAGGRLQLAVQVSDNSAARVLDNARAAAAWGADVAIIAPPATFMNATASRIAQFYAEAIRHCPLPVGIYDLGKHRAVEIPEAVLMETYLQPNVALVKDSSGSPARRDIALAARKRKPALNLFNGDEFRCLEYLRAGYNGVMFGGVAAVGPQLRQVVGLFAAGHAVEAEAADAEMRRLLQGIYGGAAIACWLTGLKYCLVRRGIFTTPSSFLDYPLTDECRGFIERYASTLAGR